MRFNAAFTALVSSASFMGYALAEEAEAVPDVAAAIERPTFTVLVVRDSSTLTLANFLSANCPEGSLLGAVHLGLGVPVEAFKC